MPGKLKPRLSQKQIRFAREYAQHGNGTQAARDAGYKQGSSISVQAHENLRKPNVISRVNEELAKYELKVTPGRVQQRLHEISHASEDAGQFGPAVRAEELLGKSIGMWVDQTLQLTGALNDSHITALLELAKRRREEPVDLADDQVTHKRSTHDDD